MSRGEAKLHLGGSRIRNRLACEYGHCSLGQWNSQDLVHCAVQK
jgi:hypothetical protein